MKYCVECDGMGMTTNEEDGKYYTCESCQGTGEYLIVVSER